MMGGPIGVGVGLFFGSMFDDEQEQTGHPGGQQVLAGEIRWEEDPDGWFFMMQAGVFIPEGSGLIVRVLESSGTTYIKSRVQTMADDDGDFSQMVPCENGLGCFYLPNAALKLSGNQDLILEAVAVQSPGTHNVVIGLDRFHVNLQLKRSWKETIHWRPVIGLCMAVARADGKLDPAEIKQIRQILEEGLNLPKGESKTVQTLLKNEPSASVDQLCIWLMRRFPMMQVADILSAMADVAKSDGHVDAREVEVIRRTAMALGMSVADWDYTQNGFGLGQSEGGSAGRRSAGGRSTGGRSAGRRSSRGASDAHALLGVSPGANRSQIKKAYHAKLQDYHPDKVATLAPEFQELANQKTIELREAYEALVN
jgi:uncharacterized tellurite resistance protein B-like protein